MSEVLAVAATLFGLRLSGLSLPRLRLPALTFVPVSVLAALAATGLGHQGPLPLVAAAAGALAGLRARRMWVCIVVGLAVYALLEVV